MILGIHYFITKLKTKIDVIPRGCFNPFKLFLFEYQVTILYDHLWLISEKDNVWLSNWINMVISSAFLFKLYMMYK